MAPQPNPAKFLFAVGMTSVFVAAMTWAMAQPSLSPMYRPELFLLY
jgi:hypothetical protein